MSRRFTVEQRKKIKSLVLEGVCQHKATGDIRRYIKENIGFEISEAEQLREGISFEIDNVIFSHHVAAVNGIQLHYVMGGKGAPIVLLHGWPQTWYEWRHVMPALAKNYTVIVPDLRGFGDSSKPTTGYDGNTTAEDIS